MKAIMFLVLKAVFIVALIGCGPSKILLDASAVAEKQTYDDTYSKVKTALVTNGFDIKDENKESGYLATTYKKRSYNLNSNPDVTKSVIFRFQIRATISKSTDEKIRITLIPGLKEVTKEEKVAEEEKKENNTSLLGAALQLAKTRANKPEEEDLGEDKDLPYYEGEDREIGTFTPEDKKIKIAMLNTFLKVTDDVANACGLTKDQLKFTITQ